MVIFFCGSSIAWLVMHLSHIYDFSGFSLSQKDDFMITFISEKWTGHELKTKTGPEKTKVGLP